MLKTYRRTFHAIPDKADSRCIVRDMARLWLISERVSDFHCFSWAADTEYVHDIVDVPGGPKMHFFYKEDDKYSENWRIVQPYSVLFMQYFIGFCEQSIDFHCTVCFFPPKTFKILHKY